MFSIETNFDKNVNLWRGSDALTSVNVQNGWGQLLLNELEKAPDEVIQINYNTGRKILCSEMRLKSIYFAEILANMGVRSEDYVSIICSHHDDLLSVVVGSLIIGAIINPLDISFTVGEMSHFMKMTEPKLVICDGAIVDRVQESLRIIGHTANVLVFGESKADVESIDDLLIGFETTSFVPNGITDLEQTAFVLCTSGTTGTPKGVLLTHSMMMNAMKMWWNVIPGEISFSASNLLWLTSYGMISHSILYRCPRIIVEATKPITPHLIVDIVNQHKVSVLLIAPSLAMELLKLLEDSNGSIRLQSIRLLVSAGSYVSDALIHSMNKFLPNGKMFPCYGMTEICGLISSAEMSYKKDTVGQLVPGIDVTIIDDANRRMGPGEKGEICIKPRHYRIKGYLKNESENRKSLDENNGFHTGDIGYFDEQGFLYLVDRKKAMLKYRNYQISPTELELCIHSNFPLKSVCVIGINDETCGELPAAVIVRNEDAVMFTEDAVMKLIADNFSDAKRLRGGVFFVDSLPMTNTGKIQRSLVKEMISRIRKS